jgi:hypothetical protein
MEPLEVREEGAAMAAPFLPCSCIIPCVLFPKQCCFIIILLAILYTNQPMDRAALARGAMPQVLGFLFQTSLGCCSNLFYLFQICDRRSDFSSFQISLGCCFNIVYLFQMCDSRSGFVKLQKFLSGDRSNPSKHLVERFSYIHLFILPASDLDSCESPYLTYLAAFYCDLSSTGFQTRQPVANLSCSCSALDFQIYYALEAAGNYFCLCPAAGFHRCYALTTGFSTVTEATEADARLSSLRVFSAARSYFTGYQSRQPEAEFSGSNIELGLHNHHALEAAVRTSARLSVLAEQMRRRVDAFLDNNKTAGFSYVYLVMSRLSCTDCYVLMVIFTASIHVNAQILINRMPRMLVGKTLNFQVLNIRFVMHVMVALSSQTLKFPLQYVGLPCFHPGSLGMSLLIQSQLGAHLVLKFVTRMMYALLGLCTGKTLNFQVLNVRFVMLWMAVLFSKTLKSYNFFDLIILLTLVKIWSYIMRPRLEPALELLLLSMNCQLLSDQFRALFYLNSVMFINVVMFTNSVFMLKFNKSRFEPQDAFIALSCCIYMYLASPPVKTRCNYAPRGVNMLILC